MKGGDGNTGFRRGVLWCERGDESGERVVVCGVCVDVVPFHGAAGDEEMGEAVEKGEIAFGAEGDVERGGLGRLGGAGIDDDDFGLAAVSHYTLPHDRMGNARIRTDEDQRIALLEVSVSEWWSIEAEGLFVGDVRGGHALAGVAVAVQTTHAEFEQCSEEGHFLHGNLAGAEKRDRMRAVGSLDSLKLSGKGGECGGPVDRGKWCSARSAEERGGGAVGRSERRQSFPAFGTGHAEVDRVIGIGGEVDSLPLGIKVDAKRAAGAAKAADHVDRRGRSEAGREAPEAEPVVGGMLHELGRHWTAAGVEEIFEHGRRFHTAGRPGILGESTARKKR